jgi:ABC-type nitrate/sulfonate/bicarbonate transport system permease component
VTVVPQELERAGGRAKPSPRPRRGGVRTQRVGTVLAPILAVAAVLLAWELAVDLGRIPAYVLPSPLRVITMGFEARTALWVNTLPTLFEAVVGVSVTIVLSFVVATACDFSAWFRRAVYPPLVASQSIPILVLAPLMVIWFGFGLLPKVLIIALVTFFPVTVSLIDGFASADKEYSTLLRSMGAKHRQEFFKVRLPSALPNFFTGLRISMSYSIAAAVLGEYVGAKTGLGVFMAVQAGSNRTDLVLAAVLVSSLLSVALFATMFLIERLIIPWSVERRGR